jgi:hypothetical protein
MFAALTSPSSLKCQPWWRKFGKRFCSCKEMTWANHVADKDRTQIFKITADFPFFICAICANLRPAFGVSYVPTKPARLKPGFTPYR